ANGLIIGRCNFNDTYPTIGGTIKNNIISMSDDIAGPLESIVLRGTSDILLKGNQPSDDPFLECDAEMSI
ncbi:MAG: hypothetical protein OEX82_07230, partial [Nitrosomonas sp.]|nr:hypothetical protein [Nitrosomonas sp.]